MKSGSVVKLASAAGLATAQTVPTVHIPLNLYYGANHKVSTNLYIASANRTIEVVYDQGSENFFLFGPGSIDNWGSSGLGSQGPCNVSVPPELYFDYPNSPTASAPVNHSASYAYGTFDKIYTGTVTVNDTFGFVNDAGARTEAVDDIRVEIVNFLVQRINDPTCSSSPLYDPSILGTSPYYNTSSRMTTGPHIRQDLLERGVIDAPVQSMWFDEAPEDVYGTYTGGGLFGGIDTSKYSGDLVKVQTLQPSGYVGYFTEMPTVTVNGVSFTKPTSTEYCQLDSGTHDDSIPVAWEETDAFYNASGIVTSPKGYTSWPGECDTIPANATVDLTFAGTVEGESLTIPVPIKSYVRVDYGDLEPGYCILSVETSGCLLGAPFATASFFAADDEAGQIALANGGVSKPGSTVDEASVIARIP
ncbi:putative Peptidase A1 domain-containing protein [Seiridium cardinale]|uniref:Peptidase A1 domain-containing protein n=1 Tax=Seiridium cardinale TaxID=138064 RepID=A0ABR2XVD8_9PEZI